MVDQPEPPGGDEAAYELAYTQGIRWLDDQVARLDTLRARIPTLLSAATVVAGIIITQVFSASRRHPLTAPGTAALLVSAAALGFMCIALVRIWWPSKKDFSTNLDPRRVIEGVDENPGVAIGSVYRDFAFDIGNAADANQVILTKLQRWFGRASVAFLVGLVALGVALWDVLT